MSNDYLATGLHSPVLLFAPGAPDHPFVDEDDSDSRYALALGDPCCDAGLAISGTRDQLEDYAERILATVTRGEVTERSLSVWVHTEAAWRDLEAALGLPRLQLGRFKEWNPAGPKHLGAPYDLDAAIAWARRTGTPYEEDRTVRYPGTLGTIDADGDLQLR